MTSLYECADHLQSAAKEDFAELVRRYRKGEALCVAGDREWVQGSVVKGMTLLQMRKAHPADKDFGAALAASGIALGGDDRAALIWLAEFGEEEMRKRLTNANSRSYQVIRREHNKLSLVS